MWHGCNFIDENDRPEQLFRNFKTSGSKKRSKIGVYVIQLEYELRFGHSGTFKMEMLCINNLLKL